MTNQEARRLVRELTGIAWRERVHCLISVVETLRGLPNGSMFQFMCPNTGLREYRIARYHTEVSIRRLFFEFGSDQKLAERERYCDG